MRTHTNIKFSAQRGFTLIEMMLVITVFSLMLTIAYQSIVASAQANSIVAVRIADQAMLRAAHRTLQQAFASGARINGSVDRMEIDMRYADSHWLDGTEKVLLRIGSGGELHAFADNSRKATVLLNGLEKLRFLYMSEGLEYSAWDQQVRPDSIVLDWQSADTHQQWWFSRQ